MNKSPSSSSSSSPQSTMGKQVGAVSPASAAAVAAAVANLPFSIDHILSSQSSQQANKTATVEQHQRQLIQQHQQQQQQQQAAMMMLNQSISNNQQHQHDLISSAMLNEQLALLAANSQAHLINPNALASVAHQQQLMAMAAAAAANQRQQQQQQQQSPALNPLDALNSLKLAVSQANTNNNASQPPNLLSCFMASILRLQQHQQQQQAHKHHSLIEQQRRTSTNMGLPAGPTPTSQPNHLNHQSQQRQQILATNFHRSLTNQTTTTSATQPFQLTSPEAPPATTTTPTTTTMTTTTTMNPPEKLDTSKPAHSYIGLIGMCILSSPEKRMVLNDVYQFILDNYPYYRNRGSGWRNSVRHNLSLNECFQKAGRAANGKGHYWTIHPANMEDFMNGDFRRRRAQRKVRRWNNMDVPSDESDDESMEDATKPPLPEHFKRSLEMHRRLELSYLQWQVSRNQLNGNNLAKSD